MPFHHASITLPFDHFCPSETGLNALAFKRQIASNWSSLWSLVRQNLMAKLLTMFWRKRNLMTKTVANIFWWSEGRTQNLISKTVVQNFWWRKVRKQNLETETVGQKFWWRNVRKQNLLTKTVDKFDWWGKGRKQHLMTKTVDNIFGEVKEGNNP